MTQSTIQQRTSQSLEMSCMCGWLVGIVGGERDTQVVMTLQVGFIGGCVAGRAVIMTVLNLWNINYMSSLLSFLKIIQSVEWLEKHAYHIKRIYISMISDITSILLQAMHCKSDVSQSLSVIQIHVFLILRHILNSFVILVQLEKSLKHLSCLERFKIVPTPNLFYACL